MGNNVPHASSGGTVSTRSIRTQGRGINFGPKDGADDTNLPLPEIPPEIPPPPEMLSLIQPFYNGLSAETISAIRHVCGMDVPEMIKRIKNTTHFCAALTGGKFNPHFSDAVIKAGILSKFSHQELLRLLDETIEDISSGLCALDWKFKDKVKIDKKEIEIASDKWKERGGSEIYDRQNKRMEKEKKFAEAEETGTLDKSFFAFGLSKSDEDRLVVDPTKQFDMICVVLQFIEACIEYIDEVDIVPDPQVISIPRNPSHVNDLFEEFKFIPKVYYYLPSSESASLYMVYNTEVVDYLRQNLEFFKWVGPSKEKWNYNI